MAQNLSKSFLLELRHVLADITATINPVRRERSCPRAVTRARHNNYRVKKPGETAVHHPAHPRSTSTRWYPEQNDQPRLRGIVVS